MQSTTVADESLNASPPAETTKSFEDKIRQKLLAHVPTDQDIDTIWEECGYWWHVWHRMFPELSIDGAEAVPQYIKKTIACGTVLALSKTLLCLALGVQQLSNTVIRRRLKLPIPGDELINHYVHTVEKYVFAEDRYCTTLEGLEIAILLSKLHSNAGRPRKAWLMYRRAISFALLLGLNRKNCWQATSTDPKTGPRRRSIFWALFQGDRYFSLILGLPYSLSDQQCDIEDITNKSMDFRGVSAEHLFRLSNLGGRLVDRYQNPDLVSLSATMKYDKELEEMSFSLPSVHALNLMTSKLPFNEIYDRSLAVLYHHYIRILLHLPYMLKSGTDRRYEYNRIAAVESAREMIGAYKFLRAGVHGDYCNCRTVDFQVFLACVLLAINVLAFLPLVSQKNDPVTDEYDWNLIGDVKAILVKASKDTVAGGSNMEDSAIKTLDLLLSCRHGCDESDMDCSTKITIPYFGTITVLPREEAIAAWEQARKQLLTPSQTVSSAGSPLGPQWQVPTPPPRTGSMSCASASGKASPLAQNPYIAFDPMNIPMPSGYSSNSSLTGSSSAFDFNNNSMMMTDWSSGYNWLDMSGDGLDFDLDNEWRWVTGNSNQVLNETGQNNQTQGQTLGLGTT